MLGSDDPNNPTWDGSAVHVYSFLTKGGSTWLYVDGQFVGEARSYIAIDSGYEGLEMGIGTGGHTPNPGTVDFYYA